MSMGVAGDVVCNSRCKIMLCVMLVCAWAITPAAWAGTISVGTSSCGTSAKKALVPQELSF